MLLPISVAMVVLAQAQTDSIPQYDTLSLRSTALGELRHINIHVPKGYSASTSTRFPVLYMPDGGIDEDFPHVVNTVDSLIALGAIRPVIVVGVPNRSEERRVGKERRGRRGRQHRA